jgi:hypothetical protein
VNFCLAQAICSQQPDLVRKIKAAYEQFPRSSRGSPTRPSTVKLLVAKLALVPQDPAALLASDSLASNSITHLSPPDILPPDVYYGQTDTALVSFHDHAAYKQFPRSARGRPSRPSTVKLLVAELALVTQYPAALLASDSLASNSITHLSPPYILAPDVYYCQTGTALVSFHDHADYKQFPHSARGRPSQTSTVKLLVAELALLPQDPAVLLASDSLDSNSITHLSPPYILTPDVYYGQTGTALVSFHDHTDVAGLDEPPAISVLPPPVRPHIFFQSRIPASLIRLRLCLRSRTS